MSTKKQLFKMDENESKKQKNAKELELTDFRASKGWFQKFLSRNRLALRKKTNHKNHSPEEKLTDIERFHCRLRLFLATGLNPHPKWGRFVSKNRYNVDQVPLPFVCYAQETYDYEGEEAIWI
jgi:hypothetical protein